MKLVDGSKIRLLLLGFVFVGFACLSPSNAASFQGLGDLPGGDFESGAYNVSADGSVVVGGSSSASGTEAFRWTDANGIVGLGDLPGGDFLSWAPGVSADGSIVVGYGDTNTGYEAFRWTEANGMVGLGDLPGGDFDSWAESVSADGSIVVGGSSSASGYEAFRWTEANGMVGLGDLPDGDFESYAMGVSVDGSIVVGGSDANTYEAFRWTDANGMVGLGDLPGGAFYSWASGVSADGSVVVGTGNWSSSNSEAFRWTDANGMVGLGDLPGGDFESCAMGVSADGSIVVGYGDTNTGYEAFIWDANNGMLNLKDVLENSYGLDLTGWTLGVAQGISADGLTIVGGGTNPDGNSEGWIAVIDGPAASVTLTVGVEPNDIGLDSVTPGIGEHSYYQGCPVILSANAFVKCPDVWRFDHWLGDVAEPNSSTIMITMNEDKTVTAVFFADERKCGDECHPILQGDLNEDCYINLEDFAIYADNWLSCTHPDCD